MQGRGEGEGFVPRLTCVEEPLTSILSLSKRGEADSADRGIDFSAVLLAGGESRRMGKDKATLSYRGKPLWQIQLELLRQLTPQEIFVSARSDPDWRPADIQFVADDPPSRGPLSGLADRWTE